MRNIFLSAVSQEFGSYRAFLAGKLRTLGLNVKTQEEFRLPGRQKLLEMLHDFIRDCDAVVHLVGDGYGEVPHGEQLQALGERHPDLLPSDGRQRSYTQWEYHFAQYYGRDCRVYAAKDAPPDPGFSFDESEQALQQEHLAAMQHAGEVCGSFSGPKDLALNALIDLVGPELAERVLRRPSNLEASIGTLFKGRKAFLELVRSKLTGRESGAAAVTGSQALHGLGGVGKTRLAVEYGHRYADQYTALLVVSADSPGNLRRNLAKLCGALVLNLPEKEATEEAVQTAAALRWLKEHPGWLLILDNVDTPEAAAEVEGMLGALTEGHVLITSRLANWSAAVEPLELSVLDVEAALAFLLERTDGRRRPTDDEDGRVRELAGELDGLALGLEQAAAQIRTERLSFARYLTRWRKQREEVLKWFDKQQMRYPTSVAVTWETSFAQLSDAGQRLLNLLCWFATDPIPEWLLEDEHELEGIDDAEEALADLAAYSLVTRNDSEFTFELHRLVQEVARRRLARASEAAGWLEQALVWLNQAFEGDPQDVRTWPRLDPLAPHALSLAAAADEQKLGGPQFPTGRLLYYVATLLLGKAEFAAAEPHFRNALAIDEASYGPGHPSVGTDLNNLAFLLQQTNRAAEAEPLHRRALAISEARGGPGHPEVATSLNNLALLLQDTNRAAEAEPLHRRALAIREAAYGRKHPEVATSLNNLAELLRKTDPAAEAEPLHRRALAIRKASYGPEHPEVATSLNNLAELLRATDRAAEAEQLHRRALAITETSLGPGHPEVATSLNNLALLLQETNGFAEAERLHRRALAIREASFGSDHPEVAVSLNNLAFLLQETNRAAEAEPLSRRHLQILRRFELRTGHKHPHCDVAISNHVGLLMQLGHTHEQASEKIKEALRAVEKEERNSTGG